jgi:hypothetical protein
MPNLNDTIELLKLQSGGPGSGRYPYGIHPSIKEYTRFKSGIPAGKAHDCQTNAARANRKLGETTVVGHIVERKSRGKWQGETLPKDVFFHAWNVDKDGNAVDHTLGDRGPKEYRYFGRQVNNSIGQSGMKIDEEFYNPKYKETQKALQTSAGWKKKDLFASITTLDTKE